MREVLDCEELQAMVGDGRSESRGAESSSGPAGERAKGSEFLSGGQPRPHPLSDWQMKLAWYGDTWVPPCSFWVVDRSIGKPFSQCCPSSHCDGSDTSMYIWLRTGIGMLTKLKFMIQRDTGFFLDRYSMELILAPFVCSGLQPPSPLRFACRASAVCWFLPASK